jgi:hypothetical protein
MTKASVSVPNPVSANGNAEFGLHVFKRRASGQKGDCYTIGVWCSLAGSSEESAGAPC